MKDHSKLAGELVFSLQKLLALPVNCGSLGIILKNDAWNSCLLSILFVDWKTGQSHVAVLHSSRIQNADHLDSTALAEIQESKGEIF